MMIRQNFWMTTFLVYNQALRVISERSILERTWLFLVQIITGFIHALLMDESNIHLRR